MNTTSLVDSIFSDNNKEDYYQLLGCDPSSTEEQINAEYKIRALEHHPDKNAGDEVSKVLFQKLTEARDILCDLEQRQIYDKWRNSGIAIPYKQWRDMKDSVHQSLHWANKKTDGKMLVGADGKEGTIAGSGGLVPPTTVSRRASEGGANIYSTPKGTFKWSNQPDSDVISKFRNYEI